MHAAQHAHEACYEIHVSNEPRFGAVVDTGSDVPSSLFKYENTRHESAGYPRDVLQCIHDRERMSVRYFSVFKLSDVSLLSFFPTATLRSNETSSKSKYFFLFSSLNFRSLTSNYFPT